MKVPELLDGALLLPGGHHGGGVVDWEEEDVPVAAEPGDEERAGEGLEGELHHLCGAHPGGGDAQHHQQTPQNLQDGAGACLVCLALHAGLAARGLGVRVGPFLSWGREDDGGGRVSVLYSVYIFHEWAFILKAQLCIACIFSMNGLLY